MIEPDEDDEDDGEWVELEYSEENSTDEEEDEEESLAMDAAGIEIVHEEDCECRFCGHWRRKERGEPVEEQYIREAEEAKDPGTWVDDGDPEPESIPANVRIVKEYPNWTVDPDGVYRLRGRGEKSDSGPEEYYYPGWSSKDGADATGGAGRVDNGDSYDHDDSEDDSGDAVGEADTGADDWDADGADGGDWEDDGSDGDWSSGDWFDGLE